MSTLVYAKVMQLSTFDVGYSVINSDKQTIGDNDARWFLVKRLLVMDFTSVLCSFNLVPNFLPVSPM